TQKDILWSDMVLAAALEDNYNIRKLVHQKGNRDLIWVNTHGTSIAEKSNYILPINTFLEANQSFVNAEGREQETNKIVFGVNNKISLPNLLKLFYSLDYNFSHLKIIKEMFSTPKLLKKKKMDTLIKIKTNYINVTNYPVKSNIEDFYLSNTFTKSS